jgi:hypothetical protein
MYANTANLADRRALSGILHVAERYVAEDSPSLALVALKLAFSPSYVPADGMTEEECQRIGRMLARIA